PDLAAAKRLVAASGTAGDRIQGLAPQSQAAAAKYLVSVLNQLGYRASAKVMSEIAYFPSLGTGKPSAQVRWGVWAADFTSAANFIVPLFGCPASGVLPSTSLNDSEFCNAALEHQIARATALQAEAPVSADQAWAKADQIITDNGALVPYANP